ncbi:hypothetical protein [Methylobacterium sp. J-092]|uniref:hypothetical protein n=1 Tax=Methylobacterium sp. J-092 TaxID=2836667 RepID=UPI001FBAC566|nr:hypothetical protein [Methylobacterium sp. J-092]MCJ2007953.1 hypothetical protein [Methylobacterium sp. J-092]
MRSSYCENSNFSHGPPRLIVVCDDPKVPAELTPKRVLRGMLARGSGYGIAPPTWTLGKQERRADRPREVKKASRQVQKRLRKKRFCNAESLRLAAKLSRCDRRHRCFSAACPQCARALQRVLVRILAPFLKERVGAELWGTLSIILPPTDPDAEIDFAAERERYQTVLRRAGFTLGVFGLDCTFNEDWRDLNPPKKPFLPHACVHLHGFAPIEDIEAALPLLKKLVLATEAVPRPFHHSAFDAAVKGVAYNFKPSFERRQTIEQFDPRRAKLVRNTRHRPQLTVEQQIRAVRALDQAGLNGRIILLGVHFEIVPTARARTNPQT